MRSTYLVTYDISSPRRLQKVYKCMCGFGSHIQFSVFLCDLTPKDKIRMVKQLADLIEKKQDQVLLIHLGPANEKTPNRIDSIGRPYIPTGSTYVV
ncbi:CRISPR-associated endonuclease Cas2 [Myxococcota bacterium]|nr:CRISPR-associated endonuclease Cas2 [Myxococcota bacterium]